MWRNHASAFLRGLTYGSAFCVLATAVALYISAGHGSPGLFWHHHPQLLSGLMWLYRNLGLSLVAFVGILLAFGVTLKRLSREVDTMAPIEKIVQLEHLSDIWISLFFGVGVIWTAIGMRSALLYALGDTDSIGNDAFSVLQRLVDGGILTALSTTIVGGAGGYLMRLAKTFTTGTRLNQFYDQQERQRSSRIESLLKDLGRREDAPGTITKVREG